MAVCRAIWGRFYGRRFLGLRGALGSVGDKGFRTATARSSALVCEDCVVFLAGAGYGSEIALLLLFGVGGRWGRFGDLWDRRDNGFLGHGFERC